LFVLLKTDKIDSTWLCSFDTWSHECKCLFPTLIFEDYWFELHFSDLSGGAYAQGWSNQGGYGGYGGYGQGGYGGYDGYGAGGYGDYYGSGGYGGYGGYDYSGYGNYGKYQNNRSQKTHNNQPYWDIT